MKLPATPFLLGRQGVVEPVSPLVGGSQRCVSPFRRLRTSGCQEGRRTNEVFSEICKDLLRGRMNATRKRQGHDSS